MSDKKRTLLFLKENFPALDEEDTQVSQSALGLISFLSIPVMGETAGYWKSSIVGLPERPEIKWTAQAKEEVENKKNRCSSESWGTWQERFGLLHPVVVFKPDVDEKFFSVDERVFEHQVILEMAKIWGQDEYHQHDLALLGKMSGTRRRAKELYGPSP